MADEFRIYAACLASYNNGVLHGRWIDADGGADHMRAEIAAMLRESPCPNVQVDCPDCDHLIHNINGCPTCNGTGTVPSAEEYAIHDYDGFGSIKLGEHPDLDTVAELAGALEEHGEAFRIWYANDNSDGVDVERFQEQYRGCFKSLEDYAAEMIEDIYGGELKNLPDILKFHLVLGIARDLELGGDIWSESGDEGVHVFDNH